MDKISVMPERASTYAQQHDPLFYFMVALCALFALIVVSFVIYFGVKYRRGSKADRSRPVFGHYGLEVGLLVSLLILALVGFFWSAAVFAKSRRVPDNAIEVFVIGKQWMWHIQHSNGMRENNALHIPVGRPVMLTMISQDVVHDFFVPAFRIHQDVVPGRYTRAWFEATEPGTYRLYCGQYCGTEHSQMIGWVYVMDPLDYQEWLASGGKEPVKTQQSMEQAGQFLYNELACGQCHGYAPARAPSLVNLFGKTEQLLNNQTVVADEAYLRESVISPDAKVVNGYQPIMPSYKGQLSEDQVLELIQFIKSLASEPQKPGAAPAGAGGRVTSAGTTQ